VQIHIIAVGRIKDRFLVDGIEEYAKRMKSYSRLEIAEIPEERVSDPAIPKEREMVKRREGELLLGALRDTDIVLALDPGGEMWSSEEFASRLKAWEVSGVPRIAFLIGGALGISGELRARADHVLSLSRMTFTHPMARLILVEQIYRAFRIIRGEPYHK
jgi:23S rRNA (pseudouridine1915-N3)-methyltransferase